MLKIRPIRTEHVDLLAQGLDSYQQNPGGIDLQGLIPGFAKTHRLSIAVDRQGNRFLELTPFGPNKKASHRFQLAKNLSYQDQARNILHKLAREQAQALAAMDVDYSSLRALIAKRLDHIVNHPSQDDDSYILLGKHRFQIFTDAGDDNQLSVYYYSEPILGLESFSPQQPRKLNLEAPFLINKGDKKDLIEEMALLIENHVSQIYKASDKTRVSQFSTLEELSDSIGQFAYNQRGTLLGAVVVAASIVIASGVNGCLKYFDFEMPDSYKEMSE